MKKAIINVSTLKYARGQYRLSETLKGKTDADILLYQSERQVEAPKHSQNRYAFKTYAMVKAVGLGYDLLLWLDASMYVLKDLKPVFDHIKEHGYLAQWSGWYNDRFTTPEQKEYFGTDKGKMVSSGFIGINVSHPKGLELLRQWHKASQDGIFNFNHDVSRQDQTAISLIIENMGLEILDNNTFWSYGTPEETYPENILAIANGIC